MMAQAHPSVTGWDDPLNSKYYVIIVQYCTRLNADKLKAHLHRLNGSRFGKQARVMFQAAEHSSKGGRGARGVGWGGGDGVRG